MKTLVLTFPSILLSYVYQRIGSGQLNNMPLYNTAPENQYLNLSLKTSVSGPYYTLTVEGTAILFFDVKQFRIQFKPTTIKQIVIELT